MSMNLNQKIYTAETIKVWLVLHLAEHLNVSPESISTDDPFYGYVIGGFRSCGIVKELEDWLGLNLPSSIFYEYPDLEMLAWQLAKEQQREQTNRHDSSKVETLTWKLTRTALSL